ncbi:TATA box-binding protein-like protein 1 [Nymphon striatum]|nr:TATA box-binding protein-like protein 1 [Nymphon striatum]
MINNNEFVNHLESNGTQNNVEEDQPEIAIVINNVVCSFATRCHLDLKRIALQGANVEFRRESGMLTMKIRNPYTTASMWSSGKITCTGATSEEDSKAAGRKFTRVLQKMGFKVKFSKFRVVNVLGTCTMPFGIHIAKFSQEHYHTASSHQIDRFRIKIPPLNGQIPPKNRQNIVQCSTKQTKIKDLEQVNMSVASKKRQLLQIRQMNSKKLRLDYKEFSSDNDEDQEEYYDSSDNDEL